VGAVWQALEARRLARAFESVEYLTALLLERRG